MFSPWGSSHGAPKVLAGGPKPWSPLPHTAPPAHGRTAIRAYLSVFRDREPLVPSKPLPTSSMERTRSIPGPHQTSNFLRPRLLRAVPGEALAERAGREQVLGCCRSCRRTPRRCRRPARPTPATASRAPMSAPGHAACSEQPAVFADMRAGRPRSSERAPTAETKGALSLRAPTVIIAPQCCLVQGPRPCECALSESPLLGPCQQPRTWFPPSRSAQHPQP